MNHDLLSLLACPRHGTSLLARGAHLTCEEGCRYPVVDGVPVMLLEGVDQSLWVAEASLEGSRQDPSHDPYFIDSLGISSSEREKARAMMSRRREGEIDPVVSHLVIATCGNAYRHLRGRLAEYPIPQLRLPNGEGQILLDLGCNWGRWTLAASRKGYRAIGIDPSIGAVMAARRVARGLGLEAEFIVGDARFLPFHQATIDVVFSYSVLQHLDKKDVVQVLRGVRAALKPGGRSLIQMPSRNGLRCIYQQMRRGFRRPSGFEVRYWGFGELMRTFRDNLGPTAISVDCYFGIGLQPSDRSLMPAMLKAVIGASEGLRKVSEHVPLLRWVADSLYLDSRKPQASGRGY